LIDSEFPSDESTHQTSQSRRHFDREVSNSRCADSSNETRAEEKDDADGVRVTLTRAASSGSSEQETALRVRTLNDRSEEQQRVLVLGDFALESLPIQLAGKCWVDSLFGS